MDYTIVRIVWNILIAIVGRPLLAGNNVEAVFHHPIPAGPFLLLANHSHALDGYVLGSLLGRPVRYMANIEGVSKFAAAFSGLAGAFGKRKGMPDVASLKMALAYLKAGEPVGIFPEGDRSWDGRTAAINTGVARLARMAGVSILLARQRGSFLTMPRWAKVRRRGRWYVDFSVIDQETVNNASLEELVLRIRAGLANDDMAWASRAGIRFLCRAPAKGVSKALWACPDCGSAGNMQDDEHSIRCSSCSGAWSVDANFNVRRLSGCGARDAMIQNVPAWITWQKSFARGLTSDEFRPGVSARIDGLNRTGMARAAGSGPGLLTARGSKLVFKPDRQAAGLSFDMMRMEGFVDNFDRHCAFMYGKERWILFHGASSPLMWIDLVSAGAHWAKEGGHDGA
jgi:1-acyl-sn-glycerol-3-phosphate acyltransferase